MKKNQHLHQVVSGTLVLSVAGLIAKILGAVYRVPFQNLVGDTGYYAYQQIYPFYGIEVTLALTGLPVFISRVVAEQDDRGKQLAVARLCRQILLVAGVVIFALLTFGSRFIANVMGDAHLRVVILGLAPVFLLMPWLAVGRGVQQGLLNMYPTAFSQVSEQVVRVGWIICVAVLAVVNHWNSYRMAAWAMISASVAGLIALGTLWITNHSLWQRAGRQSSPLTWHRLTKRLLTEGVLLCWLASVTVILQLVDSFTVKRALVAGGLSEAAAHVSKGIFDRGQPLLQLGLVIATSFSAALLPSLAEKWRHGQRQTFVQVYRVLFHVCITLATIAAAGMMTLMPVINTFLFKNSRGSWALVILMLAVPLAALVSAFCAVLQSVGHLWAMTSGLLAGLVVKCLVNYPAVRALGIDGAAWGTVVSLLTTLLFVWRALPAVVHQGGERHFVVKLLVITGVMVVVTGGGAWLMTSWLGSSRLSATLVLLVAIGVGAVVAIGLILHWQLLTIEELMALPGGEHLVRQTMKESKENKSNETR
ncbi:MAG TPA: polysaccharide biosynthesis protein [Candidatus Limosilactobacillus merdipullorum]|uniref:Polysaccharide biosynthesis protein n=1 Tax=Candidatus Limosilactobacillus merdipullorum TaxID=2838653 RepID=A0A9D1QNV2_9LACO|nr:polysaccharide biosynthesis protein [Candidatus Limosilactobacillus merdipullorum]